MKINTTYISRQNTYDNNDKKNIVIHNTDNFKKGADAKAHAKAQHDRNFKDMSAHVYTDDTGAWQAAPFERGCWHVGVNYGGKLFGTVNNRNSIAIEMCVNEGCDYEKAFLNTVEVTKQLMKQFNIPASRVYSHYDVCAKNCPSQIRARGDWTRFKKLISGAGTTVDISGTVIDDTTVEEIAKVCHGEAGVIGTRNGYLGVAQCIHDMWKNGDFGQTVKEVMKKNYSAYGHDTTDDTARQAVYDVFKNGVKRFENAVILQFRSFTNYSDGNGKIDKDKCAVLLSEYQYLGKDKKNNKWGHLYFGHKTEAAEPVNKQNKVQCGSFSKKENADNLVVQLKTAGFSAIVKKEDGQYKVQAGAYDILANAQAQVQRLKAAGFDAIVK